MERVYKEMISQKMKFHLYRTRRGRITKLQMINQMKMQHQQKVVSETMRYQMPKMLSKMQLQVKMSNKIRNDCNFGFIISKK